MPLSFCLFLKSLIDCAVPKTMYSTVTILKIELIVFFILSSEEMLTYPTQGCQIPVTRTRRPPWPQAATAAAAALYITDRAGVQPIGLRLSSAHKRSLDLAAKQPHAAQVCHLMVSTPVMHAVTWITTHIPTPQGRKV